MIWKIHFIENVMQKSSVLGKQGSKKWKIKKHFKQNLGDGKNGCRSENWFSRQFRRRRKTSRKYEKQIKREDDKKYISFYVNIKKL